MADMSGDQLKEEILALLDHFEQRGLKREYEAIGIMGATITAMLRKAEEVEAFIGTLRRASRNSRQREHDAPKTRKHAPRDLQ